MNIYVDCIYHPPDLMTVHFPKGLCVVFIYIKIMLQWQVMTIRPSVWAINLIIGQNSRENSTSIILLILLSPLWYFLQYISTNLMVAYVIISVLSSMLIV